MCLSQIEASLRLKPLPNDKILALTKFKAFADDKIIVTQNLKFVLVRVQNIVGKRRKCWLPAFSPFPTMFYNSVFSRGGKIRNDVVMG